MAGAGYKLFTTGQVLTAAEVNTYLQEQVIMVFNDATARTTALSGVLAEGMVSYLKSTKVVEIYNGTAWASLDDPNAIQNTIVDAKGDLISASAADVPARLAVGNNGETLVANSSASVGLSWQGNFAAGKNKIVNGDFSINQRNFTSVSTNDTFTFDRWNLAFSGGTVTCTPQTFTAGSAPIAGYEGVNFAQIVTASQSAVGDFAIYRQRIEDVRTFANQTITFSFFARATSGTPQVSIELDQTFGTSGSAAVQTQASSAFTLSTSWTRYSTTITLPTISGKTIGTNSFLAVNIWLSAGSTFASRSNSIGVQNNTFQIWGVQLEAGSVATAFQTATGTLAGELLAAQRYYWRPIEGTATDHFLINGYAFTTTDVRGIVTFPTTMRVAPSLVITGGTNYFQWQAATSDSFDNFLIYGPTQHTALLYAGSSQGVNGVVAGQGGGFYTLNAAASVAFNAEL